MSEAFQHLQRVAPLAEPLLVVVPGVICVLGGLCLWLGGLRASKFVACLLGSICGLVCAFLFTNGGIGVFAIVAVIWMFFGLIFERVTIAFAGAIVVVAICLVAFTWLALDANLNCPYPEFIKVSAASGSEQIRADMIEIGKQFAFFTGKVVEAAKTVSTVHFILSVSVGLAIFIGGFLKGKFTAAASCSLMGTLLVFHGMILLLMYKGATPLTIIYMKAQYYGIASAAMVVAGTAVQLMLCPSKLRIPKLEQIPDGDEQPKKRLRF
ncbi:MAG TPA: hypothetical protein ENH94_07140 [Phycisphaerales bacterium]|nr:hypothetical protein [Phycisphaerales bacterium]